MHYYFKTFVLLIAGLLLFSCKKDKKTAPANDTTIPEAAFTWTGMQRVDNDIQFVNASKNADSYLWNFGNGQTSTKQTPDKVKYAAAGVYDVVLTAIKGTRSTTYKQTLAIAGGVLPWAHFSFTYQDGKTSAPAVVQFHNESANAVTYKWVVNGNNYFDNNPKVTFNQAGDHEVILTATNANGQAIFKDTVNITVNNDPQAGFVLAYHPFPYKVNELIQLVNRSKNADMWEWTFGNNGPAPSSEENPLIKFAAAGDYAITLVAKKGDKRSAPKTITIRIQP